MSFCVVTGTSARVIDRLAVLDVLTAFNLGMVVTVHPDKCGPGGHIQIADTLLPLALPVGTFPNIGNNDLYETAKLIPYLKAWQEQMDKHGEEGFQGMLLAMAPLLATSLKVEAFRWQHDPINCELRTWSIAPGSKQIEIIDSSDAKARLEHVAYQPVPLRPPTVVDWPSRRITALVDDTNGNCVEAEFEPVWGRFAQSLDPDLDPRLLWERTVVLLTHLPEESLDPPRVGAVVYEPFTYRAHFYFDSREQFDRLDTVVHAVGGEVAFERPATTRSPGEVFVGVTKADDLVLVGAALGLGGGRPTVALPPN